MVLNNWRAYETFLLRVARANPTTMPVVVQLIVSYNHNGYPVGKDRLRKLIEDVITKSAPVAHHSEVAWALFLAKALSIEVSENSAQAVCRMESSVCALLSLDLRQKGLIKKGLDTALWEQSLDADGLVSNMWLLAYEADLKGWLIPATPTFSTSHTYFGVLRKHKVSFYNEKRNVPHISKTKPLPKPPAQPPWNTSSVANLASYWSPYDGQL